MPADHHAEAPRPCCRNEAQRLRQPTRLVELDVDHAIGLRQALQVRHGVAGLVGAEGGRAGEGAQARVLGRRQRLLDHLDVERSEPAGDPLQQRQIPSLVDVDDKPGIGSCGAHRAHPLEHLLGTDLHLEQRPVASLRRRRRHCLGRVEDDRPRSRPMSKPALPGSCCRVSCRPAAPAHALDCALWDPRSQGERPGPSGNSRESPLPARRLRRDDCSSTAASPSTPAGCRPPTSSRISRACGTASACPVSTRWCMGWCPLVDRLP